MKKAFAAFLGISALIAPAALVLAAPGPILANGGLGQVAGNIQSFGVAVCNNGSQALVKAVPVSVSANGRVAATFSASPIKAGACAYSYLSYGDLGLQPGTTHSVTVTINNGAPSVYSVTVPSAKAAAATGAGATQTANVNVQSGNFFTMVADWLSGLFRTK